MPDAPAAAERTDKRQGSPRRVSAAEIARLNPYKFMATIGKRVIHPGGRASIDTLFRWAGITDTIRVLDVGCGVATTAVEVARRFDSTVTAVDIAPLMLQRAAANVAAAGMSDRVRVVSHNILGLAFDDGAFDGVIAESVTMFVDRSRAAAELAPVTAPGGRVLATEFFCGSRRRRRPARCSSARCAPDWPSTRSRIGSASTKRPGSPGGRPRPGRSR